MNKGKVPFVIYTDSKRYWNIFKPICDEFEKRETECLYLTASPDDPSLTFDYKYIKAEFIGEGNKGFARLNMLKAYICLSTTPGLDVLQWKRSRDVDWYVHTYHTVGDSLGYRMFGIDYYDAILKTGQHQERAIRALEKVRNLPAKETVTVGSTHLDAMKKRADQMDLSKRESENKIILLAPSWGESSILNKYGANLIQKLVETGYKIVIRPHPQSKISDPEMLDSLQKQFPNSERLEWNFDNDNFDILSRSDLMISDFSGVMYDYTFIFDRPLIYTEIDCDISQYDAAWVDYVMWPLAMPPVLGHELKESDFDNLKQVIDETLASEVYAAGRKAAVAEGWEYQGEAAKRTVDYLIQKYNQLKEKEETEKK
ncbi:MAG: CDP-glycerol glycerophosphotransferase family protein [Lachnospiraceae bacterium]|nr:CDP-glycerol glycerophosphotransferase family protein [Lachnospiraceae bacterium]